MENKLLTKVNKEQKYVQFVIERLKVDNAFRAALSRADNPDLEYQSWEYLANWCDLENEWERKPFALVSAAISRNKPEKDGILGIGASITRCYENGNESDQAKTKLRRLLSCDSVKEVCLVLRPLMRLIASHGVSLC